jgi:hypothetical protein
MFKFKNVNSLKSLHHIWTKSDYTDLLEPICELIDNSISADSTKIIINIDFDKESSIEDNGHGLPSDPEELSRCFAYGNYGINTSDLNEHGCGMKTALSVLDKSDKLWSCQWKKNGTIYNLKSSFTSEDHTVEIDYVWNGSLSSNGGVLLKFPLNKEGFRSLFSVSNPKLNTEDIIDRICIDFSHRWMFHPKIRNETINIIVNGKIIKPAFIPEEYVERSMKEVKKLRSNVDLKLYKIKETIDKSWFKKTQTSSGFYFFKNGRFIQSIVNGIYYKKLFGRESHNDDNGFICLVNITGLQSETPPTATTKNKFIMNDPLLVEIFDYINTQTVKFNGEKKETEDCLFRKFIDNRKETLKEETHTFLRNEMIEIPSRNTKTPQLDGYETLNGRVNIYEAKSANKVSLDNINQLFANWIYTSESLDANTNAKPILVINADSFKLSDDLESKIKILDERCEFGFPLQIWNYQSKCLYSKA